MTGRQSEDTPRSKRLMTDDRSNVLVYMTGHGGEDFLKFLVWIFTQMFEPVWYKFNCLFLVNLVFMI